MLANQAFGSLWKLWLAKKHVSPHFKIQLYNCTVKAIMLYNLSTLPASDHQIEAIAMAHRRHLRNILQIRHPQHISNANLYTQTKCRHILLDIMEQRLKLFGHILRNGTDTPAFRSIIYYLTNPLRSKPHPGRTPTTLPGILDRDLMHVNLRLRTIADLSHIQELAMNRTNWSNLVTEVVNKKTTSINEEIRNQENNRRRYRLASQRNFNQREITISYLDGNQLPKRIRITAFSPTSNAPQAERLILRLKRRRPPAQDDEDPPPAKETPCFYALVI